MSNPKITFVAVKWGVKYAADYVNILYDMICRNLPADFPFTFVCFTDDSTGFYSAIETRALPTGLTGWWNKLYLFKAGLFREGTRLFFLDLDTIITGDLSNIAAYQGDFAIMRNFYKADGFNSGLILWRAGYGASIWESYEAAGYPDLSGGDQVWIERCKIPADILQDLFPNMIISFKEKARFTLPAGAKIVCFHGQPRPHEVRNGWVEKFWKIGGETSAASQTTDAAQPIENVRHALGLSVPSLDTAMPIDNNRQICIVGGGASAENLIDELKQRQEQGNTIWALNHTYNYLNERGLTPDAHIMSAPDARHANDVPQEFEGMMLYASQCHPTVFERAKQSNRLVMWHALIDGIHDLFGNRKALVINGNTTGMRAVGLAQLLGYGNIHLYGFDSSYPAAAPQKTGEEHRQIEVKVDTRMFVSTPLLAQQINDFRILQQSLRLKGVTLSLHGDGLLPYVAKKLAHAFRH